MKARITKLQAETEQFLNGIIIELRQSGFEFQQIKKMLHASIDTVIDGYSTSNDSG